LRELGVRVNLALIGMIIVYCWSVRKLSLVGNVILSMAQCYEIWALFLQQDVLPTSKCIILLEYVWGCWPWQWM